MANTKELYDPLDRFLSAMKKEIKEAFYPLSLAGFDELNVIQVQKRTERIYQKIDRRARKTYEDLLWTAVEWHYAVYGEIPSRKDWNGFVKSFLKGYDPVTEYVYENELDRKRMRLNESILAAREYQDRKALEEAVKKAANLLYTQIGQVGLDIMGAASVEAYRRLNVRTVMWNTVTDGRQCSVCDGRNRKVYPIDKAPFIPEHYNCRCYYTPGPKQVKVGKAS